MAVDVRVPIGVRGDPVDRGEELRRLACHGGSSAAHHVLQLHVVEGRKTHAGTQNVLDTRALLKQRVHHGRTAWYLTK